MARPRTPSNVLDARGAFRKNPKRGDERANEPKPDVGLGPAPRHLSKRERACWSEIVKACTRGVLFAPDRIAVEMAARLLAEYREKKQAFTVSKLARLQSLLASLGMTPADRSRVKVQSETTPDELERALGT